MTRTTAIKAALCAAALLLSQFSSAAMVFVGAYPGANDQLDPDGYNTTLDEILGLGVPLYQLARVDWDFTEPLINPQTSGDLTVTGDTFNVPDDPTEATAGTFAYTGTGTLDYIAVKSNSWLLVYQMTDGMTTGDWDTALDGGSGQALSHISAYTLEDIVPDPIPLPAAAWLFGSALLGLGVVKRRKA